MVVWQWVGRAAAVLVGLGALAVVLFWPVLVWGWNGWTGLYVGVTVGRWLMFEADSPTWRRNTQSKAVPEDVR